MWPFKSREEKARIRVARAEWERFAEAASTGDPVAVREAFERLEASGHGTALPEDEQRRRREDTFRAYAEAVLADDHLSEDEEAIWDAITSAFEIGPDQWTNQFNDIGRRLLIAQAKEGRLVIDDSPKLLTNAGEEVHLEVAASLLGEEPQMLGGQVIGTAQVVVGTGTISITSTRIAFLGDRRSFEFPYSKLLGMDVFSDGVRFQVSNDEAALFRVKEGWGEVIVAFVAAARVRAVEAETEGTTAASE